MKIRLKTRISKKNIFKIIQAKANFNYYVFVNRERRFTYNFEILKF